MEGTRATGGGDVKGKGKIVVASGTPLPPTPSPMEPSGSPSDGVVDGTTPVCDDWATSQSIDMCRPLPPFFVESLAGLDGWMCDVGQDTRDWGGWPGAVSAAGIAMVGEHGCSMFGNEPLALQIPYNGENGIYQDRLGLI